MAEKKLEREYTIPLRQKLAKTTRWKRAKKSISRIRNLMKRHMKVEDVKIGRELNEHIWARGGKIVPSKVKIRAVKETIGDKDEKKDILKVNLAGVKPEAEDSKKAKSKEAKKEPETKDETKKEAKPKTKKEPLKSEEKVEEASSDKKGE